MNRVLVLGSSNTDLVLRMPRLPSPGETRIATHFQQSPGGKGANQAVAAARAAASVTWIGAVGDDVYGTARLAELADEGIDTSHARIEPAKSSGIAVILVDDRGENSIAVVPGANATTTPEHIRALPPSLLRRGDLFVAQLEVPIATVLAALEIARQRGLHTILNPAPADPAVASPEWLQKIDTLVLNEHELAELTGSSIADDSDVPQRIRTLQDLGAKDVIVTLGPRGYYLASGNQVQSAPAFPVKALDTVAAGDAFVGALAARLSQGQEIDDAAKWASAAAAITVTRRGAIAAIPSAAEVDAFLRSDNQNSH